MQIKEYLFHPDKEGIDSNKIENVRDTLKAYVLPEKIKSKDIRAELLKELGSQGWSNAVRIDQRSRISITSVLNDIGLCLQTGNVSRYYADLIKLETAYKNKVISGAIYIIPTKNWANKLGDNIANFERFIDELTIFKETITIPMVVFGLQGE
ncbi:hypothetical protein A7981_04370 [Methylovorus sp. MM2]|uniref:BglII/BstYI family type II restriction endonuclease n=1 Tax=Methylovorus sp. MM2 TaxID=1848038 RepID=UPI0007DF45A0|nr:BglII/BstYI family type II restriction endonuclease [Methylovorus sp. MM2]OAM52693.1 hypothetical protein A7981_04370 [Methylovorus sp. MM2]